MWTVIDEKWCGSVAALSYSLLEYIRKFLYPHIFSHLLSTDELNVLKSYSNFTARISLSPPFLPANSRKGKRRGGIIKQRTVGWIVGTWPKSGLGYLRTPGWGKIRQWITGPLYVASYYSLSLSLSLSYRAGDKARDPNPKYLRGVLSRGLHRGGGGGWIYTSCPIFLPSWKAQQQWQGQRGTRRLESPRA